MSDFVSFINSHHIDIVNEKFEVIKELIHLIDSHPTQFTEALDTHTLSIDTCKLILLKYIKYKEEFSYSFLAPFSQIDIALKSTNFFVTLGLFSGSFIADLVNEDINGTTVFKKLCHLSMNHLIKLLNNLKEKELEQALIEKNHLYYLFNELYNPVNVNTIRHQFVHHDLTRILDKISYKFILAAYEPVFKKLNDMAQAYQIADTQRATWDKENVGYYTQLEEHFAELDSPAHLAIRPEVSEYVEKRAELYLKYLGIIDTLLINLENRQRLYDRSFIQKLSKADSLKPFKNETMKFSLFWDACISVKEERLLNADNTSQVIEKSYVRIFSGAYGSEENAIVPNVSPDSSPSR
jgi:hypothetical protein